MNAADALEVFTASSVTRRTDEPSWADLVATHIVRGGLTEAVGNEDGFYGILTHWRVAGLKFIVSNTRNVSVRGSGTTNSDQIWLCGCLDGSFEIDIDRSSTVVEQNHIAVVSDIERRKVTTFAPDCNALWVHVPRSYFENRTLSDKGIVVLDASRGAGYLALSALQGLLSQANNLDLRQADQIASSALGFVSAAVAEVIGSHPYSLSRHRALTLHRVKQYIHDHLDDDRLSPQSISEALGLSSRYLNKLFEEEGTSLMRWTWERRLERAEVALKMGADGDCSISEIAYACGFKNLSHFSRVFRDRYGRPPSAFVSKSMVSNI